MRRVISGFGVLVCALALFTGHEALADRKLNSPAAKYIEALGNEALAIIHDKNIGKDKRQATLEKLFGENLDFDWVGKFVMGRFWRQATPDQKTRYLAAYKAFLTKHYTSRFAESSDGAFTITGVKESGGESVVSMEIMSGGKNDPAVLVDYKVHRVGGGFKVFDIIVEGVSLITSQRSEFASVINKSGIDGLIAQLSSK